LIIQLFEKYATSIDKARKVYKKLSQKTYIKPLNQQWTPLKPKVLGPYATPN
jgi:hypothetical protein